MMLRCHPLFTFVLAGVLAACAPVTPALPTLPPAKEFAPAPTSVPETANAPAVNEPAESTAPDTAEVPFALSVQAFADGQTVPDVHTCKGGNQSPALAWTDPPPGTLSLALLLEDPDAPGGVFTHWVLYNLPPQAQELAGNLPLDVQLAAGGVQGVNDAGKTGYFGPCPPPGKPHRYIFRLLALDLEPAQPTGLTGAGLRQAVENHILAEANWMGLYP